MWTQQVSVANAILAYQYQESSVVLGKDITIAAVMTSEDVPIVLLVDSIDNKGVSLTNCMTAIVNYVNREFLSESGLGINDAIFIQIDSDGAFDRVLPTVESGRCISVYWEPIRHYHEARTQNAFELSYGGYAYELLGAAGLKDGVFVTIN